MHCARDKQPGHYLLFCTALLVLACGSGYAQTVLVPDDATWRFHASPRAPETNWFETEFDDSGWREGKGGFGYGDGDDATILADMRDNYADVFIRRGFELTELPADLFLQISYDDAFVAYINGKVIAHASIDSNGAIVGHEADQAEVFRVSTRHLVLGRNVLAIRGINVDPSSSDFSLHPSLATKLSDPRNYSRDMAERMLASLRNRLLTQSSYLHLSGRDPIAALDAVAEKLPDPVPRLGLLAAIQQIVALLGDGHARVTADFEYDNARYLPFSLAEADVGIIAVDVENDSFVEQAYPRLVAIDGIDIERWISAAAQYVSKASPQLNRRRALRAVQRIDQLRFDLRLPAASHVQLTFGNNAGDKKTRQLPLSVERPSTARVKLGKTRRLPGNVGYLLIPRMDDDRIPEIRRWMKTFRNTDGLVIDVRNNGGGRYGILRAMAPYFLAPENGPMVTNIAKYRSAPIFDEDHLASRPTYRIGHETWSSEERELISRTMKSFQPKWTPAKDKFSDWHFMLLNRDSDRRRAHYFYDKPVIVLCNAKSFSATDGFLSAFSRFEQVTLIGQPSGGGSGRTQRFLLPEHGLRSRENTIEVALSSMASFRTNGETFDGFGIPVDIHIEPAMHDFLGDSDSVLARAVEFLGTQIAKQAEEQAGPPDAAGAH